MHPPDASAEAAALFLDEIETIEEVTGFVTRRARMDENDAEEFASWVKLRLIENEYAILRTFEGRSSFATFITIVIGRLLLDYRIKQWGKWHPSAEAKRIGDVAIELEKVVVRDGRPLEDAVAVCRAISPEITTVELQAMLLRLPKRAIRPRHVDLEDAASELRTPPDAIHAAAMEPARAELSGLASTAVRNAFAEIDEFDRDLLRMHFAGELTIAQIGRMLNVDQQQLYRRMRRALQRLRRAVERAGVRAEHLEEILSSYSRALDFGFDETTMDARPSNRFGSSGRESGGPDE